MEALRIFSCFFGVVLLLVTKMLRVKVMTFSTASASFEEAIFGAEKKYAIIIEATCGHVQDPGAKPGASPVTCGPLSWSGVIKC